MDILKRSIAPISEEAWKAIDDQAKTRLRGNLSARKVVGFSGPHGWDLGAVNRGRLLLKESKPTEGVHWGIRDVLPLIEVRIPFVLRQMELDSIARGLKNPDLAALDEAAYKAAWFEESCVYLGFEEGSIRGMAQASPYQQLVVDGQAENYEETVEQGVATIQKSGVGGPYMLALGRIPYQLVMAGDRRGYPLKKRLEYILGGSIHWSPALQGGLLFSAREGNFELTVGQDFSIGYAGHDRESIELYVTESFTFQVMEPEASIGLKFD